MLLIFKLLLLNIIIIEKVLEKCLEIWKGFRRYIFQQYANSKIYFAYYYVFEIILFVLQELFKLKIKVYN